MHNDGGWREPAPVLRFAPLSGGKARAMPVREVLMNDVPLPTKPPGHTCPGIDDARTAMRRLARAADGPLSTTALTEAYAALERVREENTALREAYIEAMAFRHVAVEAIALVRSGYDGPVQGEPVTPLFVAVANYERAKRRHANPPKRATEKTA